MTFTPFGQPKQILTRGGAAPIGSAQALRVPPGHPEGYLEGFATLYHDAAEIIRGREGMVPGIDEGLAGMRFIDGCVRSSSDNGAWVKI